MSFKVPNFPARYRHICTNESIQDKTHAARVVVLLSRMTLSETIRYVEKNHRHAYYMNSLFSLSYKTTR